VRADYFYPGGEWTVYNVWEENTGSTSPDIDEQNYRAKADDRQLSFSPRLGISIPVLHNSKFYFNYGVFRQMLEAQYLFNIQQTVFGTLRKISNIGNPSHPMPKTSAYELGYEQSFFDNYIAKLSGFIRNIDSQSNIVTYHDRSASYSVVLPYNYQDIKGFELSLRKHSGSWFRGFINYTYLSLKEGNFGYSTLFWNQRDTRDFRNNSRDHYQIKPVSQPYAYINLDFFTPLDFGPDILGGKLFGDMHFDFLAEWRAEQVTTWRGPVTDEDPLLDGFQYEPNLKITDNIRTKDYLNLDIRLGKNFRFGSLQTSIFLDIKNVLNRRHFYFSSDDYRFFERFWQGLDGPFESNISNPFQDYNDYMKSLHLPEDVFGDFDADYLYVPGNDRLGEYRKPGVAFIPIEVVAKEENLPRKYRI